MENDKLIRSGIKYRKGKQFGGSFENTENKAYIDEDYWSSVQLRLIADCMDDIQSEEQNEDELLSDLANSIYSCQNRAEFFKNYRSGNYKFKIVNR